MFTTASEVKYTQIYIKEKYIKSSEYNLTECPTNIQHRNKIVLMSLRRHDVAGTSERYNSDTACLQGESNPSLNF